MTPLEPETGVWDAVNWMVALPTASASPASDEADADQDPLAQEFETLRQELVLQAQQLASYLQAWQHDLDRRATALHAQLAQFETERRAARVWLETRTQQLEQREQALQQRAPSSA